MAFGMRTREFNQDLILERTVPVPEAGCWLWTAAYHGKGEKRSYGIIRVHGKNWKSHQLSYVLFHGPIPDGLCVLHKCDTPSCCNPDHLYTGTRKDNMADALRRNRVSRDSKNVGEKNGARRLTESVVRKIHASQMSIPNVAKKFGVSKGTVSGIRSGLLWKSLGLPHIKRPIDPTRKHIKE